jgi:hypothetical protein
MAELMIRSEESQFASSLNLVKAEIANALDQAATHLSAYCETGSQDSFKAFLAEVQQVRGTFKLLDFRAGERVCEEFAETGRFARGEPLSVATLTAFTQAILFLKRFVDMLGEGVLLPPGLLVPTINQIRRERNDAPLPDAYFFLINLRPSVQMPRPEQGAVRFPYRRARQMFQLGLIGLVRGQGRRGPVMVMQRAVQRYEKASRGGASWLFWHVVLAALDGFAQPEFELTPSRLSLLSQLDRHARHIQETDGKAFAEKQADWLLKEFVYLVSLSEPATARVRQVQAEFQLPDDVRESQLAAFRAQLHGPDYAALESLATALREELQVIKDQIDLVERVDLSEEDFAELLASLGRIGDTLMITNLLEDADRAHSLMRRLKARGIARLREEAASVADEVIQLEQGLVAISQRGLDRGSLVDPVSLKEARISLLQESMTALAMIKRAIGSYLESDGDKLHINNVGKSLLDVAGAMLFLDKKNVYDILVALDKFITNQVIPSHDPVPDHKMEAFADAITAVEYFIDSMNGQATGADDAIRLAEESLTHLQG